MTSCRAGWTILAATIWIGAFTSSSASQQTSIEAGRIRQVLLDTFDKPDAPLTVEPIVARGDHAIAGWEQSGRGGRALLRRHGDRWVIVLCAGDALKSASRLEKAGVPAALAEDLASDLVTAERTFDAARLGRFSTFEGEVVMDGSGHHPTVDHHH